MDKTRFRIRIGGKQKVVTRDARRRAFAPSSTNCDFVTVVECVSADKCALPPFVILPGKSIMEAWVINTDLPDDYSLAVSDSCYSIDQLWLHWLKRFDRHSATRQVGEYRMLIMDGYGSHCTVDFIDYCEKNKIIRFCLPSHTTLLLQPLDVLLFRSYKKAHRDVLHTAMQSCCANFNKIEFLHALQKMRAITFTEKNIASGFRKTGILPFDPSIVLNQLPGERPTTPEYQKEENLSATFSTPITPTSVRALKRHADALCEHKMSPSLRRHLTPFLKGAVALATSESLAYQQLSVRTDAQHEQAKRQQKTRQTLPTCGVMTVEDAKRKVKEKHEKEMKEKDSATKKIATQQRKENREQEKAEEKERNCVKRVKEREEKKRACEEGRAEEKLRKAEERELKKTKK